MPVQNKNQAQALAIAHADGPLQVLAGPGSGKTYLTIRRIRHLICHHGVSPDKILVITFTKAAAAEMEQRFRSLTEGAYREVRFGTFHAVYFHILNQSGYTGGRLALASAADKGKYLAHIQKLYNIGHISNEASALLLQKISAVKNGINSDIRLEDKTEGLFHEIYQEYCRIMEEENKLDFDDMILLCDRLFEERQDILARWQAMFSHILVDEFQDIGLLQYKIIRKLAAPEDNLFVVGDDDQSIYGFRGAGPDIMRQFLRDYPQARQLSLAMNYRCPEAVVKAAALVIGENKNRFPKQLQAQKEGQGRIKLCAFSSPEEEACYLLERLSQASPGELKETAVICRTNAQALRLSGQLAGLQLPYSIREKEDNIFGHPIAQDLFSYLQFASDSLKKGRGERNDLLRIMNRPCRYIHREALSHGYLTEDELINYYKEKPYMQETVRALFAHFRKIALLRPYLAVNYIRKAMGYDGYLLENKKQEEGRKLLEAADRIQQTAFPCHSLEEWRQYAASYEEELRHKKKSHAAQGVNLITMHSSKGLEYDTVYLPCVNVGSIPNPRAATAGQIEEERRLFYVAMTRAKNSLEILYHKEPSPFLDKLLKTQYAKIH